MAVRIRLSRAGRRHLPFYHISVYDIRQRCEGQYIDRLGSYDPTNKDETKQQDVDVEKAAQWLSQGAQPSETVEAILKKAGVEIPEKSKRKAKRKSKGPKAGRKVKERTKPRKSKSMGQTRGHHHKKTEERRARMKSA